MLQLGELGEGSPEAPTASDLATGRGEAGPWPGAAASATSFPAAPASQERAVTPGYDTVIVDYGNVLVAWEPLAAVAGYLTAEEWEEFVTGAGFHDLNLRSDAGEPFEDIVADLEAAHPGRPDWAAALRLYRSRVLSSLTGPVPGVAEILTELGARGTRLLGLTNFDHATFPGAVPLAPVLTLFDGVVVSGVEHMTKPDPRIYRLLMDRYQVEAGRAVFIDDSAPNVEGARAVGLTALHFTGAGRLRCDLVELGLLARP